jgi:hypothetical protein
MVVMKSTFPNTGKGYVSVIVNIINVNKIEGLITCFYPLLLLHFSTSYYMNMNTGSQQKPRYKIKQNKQKPQETQPKTWPHEYLVESRAACGVLFVWSVYG